MNSKNRHIVIIGSGISGLVCAALLAKKGYAVTVLEKNHQIGGTLQVFSRDKAAFDTGVHYVGSLDEGETLNKLFNYLGILDTLSLKRMDEHGFDVIRLDDGFSINHGMGYDNFTFQLKNSFPNNHEDVDNICQEIKKYCTYFPLYNLELDAAINYVSNPEILEVGAWDKLHELTKNEKLIHTILGSGPLYCGLKDKTPFYVLALILNSYIKGSYRFSNGSSQLAKALVKKIRSFGGKVLKRKKVIQLHYSENGEVNSVSCSDGTSYTCEALISSLHPNETIKMAGKQYFKPAYRARMDKVENTTSTFMLYLSFKKNKVTYLNANYYDYFTADFWNKEFEYSDEWPKMTFTSFNHSSGDNQYTNSCSVMCYMDANVFKEWKQSIRTVVDNNEREELYYAFKKKCEVQILDRVKQRFPDLIQHIVSIHSSSPLTYRDFLASPDGSMYGIQKDYKKIHHTQVNTRTHIPNLYLTGQNVLFHGILGASLGAMITSFHFIDKQELVSEIKQC